MKTITILELRRQLNVDFKRLGKWEAVGLLWGINRGTAWRIAKQGYDPVSPALRTKLGLPALAPAPVCPHCKIVHVGRCHRASFSRLASKNIKDRPVDFLRWQLLNREDIK